MRIPWIWRKPQITTTSRDRDPNKLYEIGTFTKEAAAEMLVTMLFRKSGYVVNIFGYWRVRSLVTVHEPDDIDGGVTNYPALIVYGVSDSIKNPPWLLGVRYRSDGRFSDKDHMDLEHQRRAWLDKAKGRFSIIMVASKPKPKIVALHFPDLKEVSLKGSGWYIDQAAYAECLRLINAGVFSWK